ncbi:MAG: hypothetical protein AAGI68_06050 [Planctomycetota bacterium]
MNAMSRRRLAPVTLLTLLAVTATLLRPAPTLAAPADGHPADQLPEFAGIPATHTNLVVVDDLMPTIRAALNSPRLLQPLNRFVNAIGEDELIQADMDDLVDWLKMTDEQRLAPLDEIEASVPKRVIVATNDQTIALFGQAMEAFAVGAIAVQAGEMEGLDDAVVAPYRARLVALAEGFVSPSGALILTMRDPGQAMQMLAGLQMLAGFAGGQPGINLDVQAASLTVDIRVGDTVNGDANLLTQGLADMGLGEPDHPQLQQLAAAIMDMEFRLAFAVQDSSFIFTLGQPVAEGEPTLSPELLGTLWPKYTRSSTGVFFARFTPTPLLESIDGIEAAFDIDPNSPLGQALAQNPDLFGSRPTDMFSLSDIQTIREGIEQMGTQQDLAIWLDGGLQLESVAQNVPPFGDLAPLNLPARLPGELPLVYVGTGQPVGETISSQLGSMIDLLETQANMQALEEADWDEEQAKPIAAAKIEQLAPLRAVLTDRAEATFGRVSGGVAGVVETAEKLTVTGGDLDDAESVTLENLPVPAGLLFVEVAEGQDGLAYLAELYTESIKAAEMFGEFEAPAAARSLAETDLGLGVKTLQADLSWVQELAAAEGGIINLELLGASSNFHAFDHQGMLVLSTSPALSKRFMEAWDANGQPVEGQDALAEMIVPEVDGTLVGLARMEPSGLVFSLRQAADSIENVQVSNPDMLNGGEFSPAQAATTMRLVADLMEELALSEFVVFDQGQTRITRGAINLSRQLN